MGNSQFVSTAGPIQDATLNPVSVSAGRACENSFSSSIAFTWTRSFFSTSFARRSADVCVFQFYRQRLNADLCRVRSLLKILRLRQEILNFARWQR
jgi:hypothetical protein